MESDAQPRVEYVEARRVLLDVITALTPQLRCRHPRRELKPSTCAPKDGMAGYQAFTTDADVVSRPNATRDDSLHSPTQ